MLEKLGLGTVQFGQPYGISNRHGQVSPAEAAAILTTARAAGIRLLDTAANYGEAEAVLAGLDRTGFRVVSKTIGLKHGLDQVIARARQSATRLKADTLLVHAAADLRGPDGDALWSALCGLRDEGVFRKIGISVYVADDPAAMAARFQPDVMQLPFSLLDQRLLLNGTLARLAERGVEIHARSIFLQGLLFLEALPEKLRHAGPHLTRVRARLRDAGITPLAGALGFVLSRPEIAFGLVGVTSKAELEEVIGAAQTPLPDLEWSSFALEDEVTLTPSLW
jgi:aryl-alcohol dehydrogenase-like predicted oxidoreductase